MAATNINRVVMTGNLPRDPELRTLPSPGDAPQLVGDSSPPPKVSSGVS